MGATSQSRSDVGDELNARRPHYPLKQVKREWMGIEPTWPLLSGHNGFEIRGGHQIRVHSRALIVLGLAEPMYLSWQGAAIYLSSFDTLFQNVNNQILIHRPYVRFVSTFYGSTISSFVLSIKARTSVVSESARSNEARVCCTWSMKRSQSETEISMPRCASVISRPV